MAAGVDRFFLLGYCLACCWGVLSAKSDLRVVRQWAELEFNFPSEGARASALSQGYLVPGNSVPIDVDVHHRQGSLHSRIFVTIPRFDGGRPMTLGTVSDDGKISAYPNYEWHDNQGENCDGMTSVFRTAIDECNRLWVMDTGKIGEKQHCPPQLLAFSLDTDQLIYRHRVNASNYGGTSLFITPVVDVRRLLSSEDCSDTHVYVADVSGFGLLVVDVTHNRSWRVAHRLFFPFPNKGSFTIDGESFDLMDGILGMALSPYKQYKDRYLYFHALASVTENVVRTEVLRNTSFADDPNAQPESINVFPAHRSSQSAAEAMDRSGILYFGLMDPPSIWCWNSASEYNPRNFHQLAINKETLQFASGIKVINNLKGEQELWVLTSSFQRVMTGSLNSKRINFRIHGEKLNRLLVDSPCAHFPKDQENGYHAKLITPIGLIHTSRRYGVASYL